MLPHWSLAADISVLWCGTSRTADHCRTFVIISAEYRQVVVSRGWSSLVVTGLSWLVVAGRLVVDRRMVVASRKSCCPRQSAT